MDGFAKAHGGRIERGAHGTCDKMRSPHARWTYTDRRMKERKKGEKEDAITSALTIKWLLTNWKLACNEDVWEDSNVVS